MVFFLTEGYEGKVAQEIRGKQKHKQLAGNLPVMGPAEDLKSVNKPPGIRMELRRATLSLFKISI
jgi:hypothetical protein